MNEIQSLLNLPVDTLVVLAAGYIGYKIAHTGRDQQHRTIDIVFICIVYGLIAKIALNTPVPYADIAIVQSGFAIMAVVTVASLWRGLLKRTTEWLLRSAKVSYEDGHITALDSIKAAQHLKCSQITVRKNDGKQLLCNNLGDFTHMPHSSFIIGEDGSIALYVTNYRHGPNGDWIPSDPLDGSYSAQITYIPANQISEVSIQNLV